MRREFSFFGGPSLLRIGCQIVFSSTHTSHSDIMYRSDKVDMHHHSKISKKKKKVNYYFYSARKLIDQR